MCTWQFGHRIPRRWQVDTPKAFNKCVGRGGMGGELAYSRCCIRVHVSSNTPEGAETGISGVPGKPGLHSAPEASLGYRRPGLRNSHLENKKHSFLESSTQPLQQSSESRPEGQACGLAETNQDAVPCITSSRSTVIGCESLQLEPLQRLRRLPGPLQAASGVRGNCDLPSPPPLGKALSVREMGDSRTLLPALSSQIMVGDTLQAASHSASLWRVCLGLGTVQCKGPKGGELSCAKAWGWNSAVQRPRPRQGLATRSREEACVTRVEGRRCGGGGASRASERTGLPSERPMEACG